MRRLAGLLWAVLVLAAVAHLGLQVRAGLRFDTDMIALLPQDEQDPVVRAAVTEMSSRLGRHFLLLVGGDTAAATVDAARTVSRIVAADGIAEPAAVPDPAKVRKAVTDLYLPYRNSLLTAADRARLQAGRGGEIAGRATAQIFGLGGFAGGNQIAADPFLLLPAYLAGLPAPPGRGARTVDGIALLPDGARTWAMLSYTLTGEPFALDAQRRLAKVIEAATQAAGNPPVLRLGTVFFARDGAETSLRETTLIGGISICSVIVLLLAVFRSPGPVWQSLLAIGVGIVCALSLGTTLFGRLHVVALLFGTSLIGTTVDYCVHYFCTVFGPDAGTSADRLRHVLPGLALGAATTLIGYSALLLAPFPGLHQIAAFSAIGILAASLSVALWFPLLDRRNSGASAGILMRAAGWFDRLWSGGAIGRRRFWLFALIAVAAGAGLAGLQPNDDVRGMQTRAPALIADQAAVQRLTGSAPALQYFLVAAPDTETALQRTEALLPRLAALRADGVLDGFRAPASYVPSAARQRADRALVRTALDAPLLASQRARIGLPAAGPAPTNNETFPVLTIEQATAALPPLSGLIVRVPGDGVVHVVALDGPRATDRLSRAAAGLPGVRFVDPVSDFGNLLSKYRHTAIRLLALSVVVMFALLVFRYRVVGSLRTLLAPVVAIAATPGLLALAGRGFSFFDAMALILILAIGADYAIFCAESPPARRRVTLLAILLAALTSVLSFGLLAFSSNFAVASFGLTMMLGIFLSFLLAPVAFPPAGPTVAPGDGA